MRLLKNLILMVLVMVMTVNAAILHTFNTFDIRDSKDQSCFTITKTTEDCTKVNLNKCTVGCGGSIKIKKNTQSQQYTLQIFSNDTLCEGSPSTKAVFVCPNPSIKSIDIKGTTNSVKCGTLPPNSKIDDDSTAGAKTDGTTIEEGETATPKSRTPTTRPTNEDESKAADDSDASSSSSSSVKPKSETNDKPKSEDAAHGNNAVSSTIFNGSLIVIALLVATL